MKVLWRSIVPALLGAALLGCGAAPQPEPSAPTAESWLRPGARTLLHAHNCYPYHGQWTDRMPRALATGTPVVIEQDLLWYPGPNGPARSIVAHNCPCDGTEPGLEQSFFEPVRPLVERALTEDDRSSWPVLILHLDLKTEEPEHLAEISALLERYDSWLTSAPRTAAPETVEPLDVRPVLAVVEATPAREAAFHDSLPAGAKLRIFGSLPPSAAPQTPATAAGALVSAGPTNYRRWWNLSWAAVEEGGPSKAGDWTAEDRARLDEIVGQARQWGVFVRFYSLNGHPPEDNSGGWSPGYNFGSLEAARLRWRAAIEAGVDWLATDQYAELAEELRATRGGK